MERRFFRFTRCGIDEHNTAGMTNDEFPNDKRIPNDKCRMASTRRNPAASPCGPGSNGIQPGLSLVIRHSLSFVIRISTLASKESSPFALLSPVKCVLPARDHPVDPSGQRVQQFGSNFGVLPTRAREHVERMIRILKQL